MAQRVVIELTDDLDGKPIKDGQGETVTFALDGTAYEIDLGKKNADSLRNDLSKYVGAARKAGRASGAGGRSRGSRAAGSRQGRDYDPKAVRAWAESQGIEVSRRGRVPADLVAKFQSANA